MSEGRQFTVQGPAMISVQGGDHMSGFPIGGAIYDLGLTVEEVRVRYYFHSEDVRVTGLGTKIPGDVQSMLSHCDVLAKLIHYDKDVLDACMDESVAGGGVVPDVLRVDGDRLRIGQMNGAGTLLMGRKEMYASGNRFFSVHLFPQNAPFDPVPGDPPNGGAVRPFRFRQCQIYGQPLVNHVGTKVQEAEVCFRALPYQDPYRSGLYSGQTDELELLEFGFAKGQNGITFVRKREILMSGAILWDRTFDEPGD